MKYLVMECHPGYAIVLDDQGHFLQVANQHFEVGQTVEHVIHMQQAPQVRNKKIMLRTVLTLAACLCLVIFGAFLTLTPYGTVDMQINPHMQITVNRLDYVLEVTPLNEDARDMLVDFDPGFKKVEQVVMDLADRALAMEYLAHGGEVKLSADSSHDGWDDEILQSIVSRLEQHTHGNVNILTPPYPDAPVPTESTETTLPSETTAPTDPPATTEPTEPPTEPPTQGPLTMEDAKAMAFSYLGITESQITEPDFKLENGEFDLEFKYNGAEYEFKIDAATGTFLEIERDDVPLI